MGPQMQMKNSDLSRLINSDEVQSVVNAPKQGQKPRGLKCNPLKNAKAMEAVNPFAAASKERYAKAQKAAEKAKADLWRPSARARPSRRPRRTRSSRRARRPSTRL